MPRPDPGHPSRAPIAAPRRLVAILLGSALALLSVPASRADAYADALVNRNTTLNLIEALVRRGVLERAEADQMIREARAEAERTVREERAGDATMEAPATAETEPVHVFYVPQSVRAELQREVEEKLAARVTEDVKQAARAEAWGVPAALPAWVNRFTLSGDLRLRAEANLFGADNQPFSHFDFLAINRAGGLAPLQAVDPRAVFFNTTEDRVRFRSRLRLAIDAELGDGLLTGLRLTTSNDRSPIGLNQTLGQTGQQYEVVIDRLFARYRHTRDDFDWLTVHAGRHPNPWFSSETLFDRDLVFEGLAVTSQIPFGTSYGRERTAGSPLANWGVSQASGLYFTLGAFALEEFAFTARDKFLLAGQGGIDWALDRRTRLKVGVAYYDYNNIEGVPNALGRRDQDFTAPRFFTRGNSLMRISNDIGETFAAPRLVGLAADFNIADVTAMYDWKFDDPLRLVLTGSFSRNVGFSRARIRERTGLDIEPRVNAWELRTDIGNTEIDAFGEWLVFAFYKRVERDAVLDAYTDSIFNQSGTDAQGWAVGGSFGLTRAAMLAARWLTSDAIDGPPLGVDVLLLDLWLTL